MRPARKHLAENRSQVCARDDETPSVIVEPKTIGARAFVVAEQRAASRHLIAAGIQIDRAHEHIAIVDKIIGMTASVFVGTSVDGFIARLNGDFDFLPAGGGEPHGYNEFMAGIDAIVIGRHTFDVVLKFSPWPYGKTRVVVLSSRPIDLSVIVGGVVEQMSGEPAEIVERLAATGAHNLYVDGGITIQRFLRAGLIQRLIITRVPVLIGEGIPLFGSLPHDVALTHIATRQFPSGLVQSEYAVT